MAELLPILADQTTSITELKKNPMEVVEHSDGAPVAVLNRNRPAFYCLPAATYAAMLEHMEDLELALLARERESQEEIRVGLDDL
ncbi:MAG: type II toxin-antitoxin system Phd/YefM family antitoxin [Halospina sp.]